MEESDVFLSDFLSIGDFKYDISNVIFLLESKASELILTLSESRFSFKFFELFN